jgi:hypothetical protein
MDATAAPLSLQGFHIKAAKRDLSLTIKKSVA